MGNSALQRKEKISIRAKPCRGNRASITYPNIRKARREPERRP